MSAMQVEKRGEVGNGQALCKKLLLARLFRRHASLYKSFNHHPIFPVGVVPQRQLRRPLFYVVMPSTVREVKIIAEVARIFLAMFL